MTGIVEKEVNNSLTKDTGAKKGIERLFIIKGGNKMNKNQRFVIKLFGILSKIIIPILVWSYLIIVKPNMFSDSDKMLMIRQFLATTPWLIVIAFMLIWNAVHNYFQKIIIAKRERKYFLENQEDEIQEELCRLKKEINYLSEQNEKLSLENRRLKKADKEKAIFIKATEETLNGFKIENKNYDRSLKND